MENLKVIRGAERKALTKNCYERRYWSKNLFVCGVDEAGRGPLAGPVVAAAVILPHGCTYRLLKDSKIMTEAERNRAYHWIIKNAWYGFGIETPHAIDTHNIYQATLRAMRRALNQVATIAPHSISGILVDAIPLILETPAYKDIPVHAFIEGESLSISVAAASIVAKVTRDRIMVATDRIIPGYNLAQHKGYGTSDHQSSLRMQGRSLIHRTSFIHTQDTIIEIPGDLNTQRSIW
jgi:ribonuclease HII